MSHQFEDCLLCSLLLQQVHGQHLSCFPVLGKAGAVENCLVWSLLLQQVHRHHLSCFPVPGKAGAAAAADGGGCAGGTHVLLQVSGGHWEVQVPGWVDRTRGCQACQRPLVSGERSHGWWVGGSQGLFCFWTHIHLSHTSASGAVSCVKWSVAGQLCGWGTAHICVGIFSGFLKAVIWLSRDVKFAWRQFPCCFVASIGDGPEVQVTTQASWHHHSWGVQVAGPGYWIQRVARWFCVKKALVFVQKTQWTQCACKRWSKCGSDWWKTTASTLTSWPGAATKSKCTATDWSLAATHCTASWNWRVIASSRSAYETSAGHRWV